MTLTIGATKLSKLSINVVVAKAKPKESQTNFATKTYCLMQKPKTQPQILKLFLQDLLQTHSNHDLSDADRSIAHDSEEQTKPYATLTVICVVIQVARNLFCHFLVFFYFIRIDNCIMESHFSFTRSAYDTCALETKNKESTAPGEYSTDVAVIENKEACFLGASPFMQNPFNSIPTNVIDIESNLRGQTNNLSKCAEHKFNPNSETPIDYKWKECFDKRLVPEYTRTDRPCNILSGITINRFHPLCDDFQELNQIHHNTYIGSNTRLQIKDAFKEQQNKDGK